MGNLLLFFLLPVFFGPGFAADFRAGVARSDITPPMPFWLSGYAARTAAATTVRNKLWAKALALADNRGSRVVIVTTDLIGLPRDLSDAVAESVCRKHGLQRSQLLLNSSHTHYGPAIPHNLSVMFDFDPAEMDRATHYYGKLTDALVAVVGAALADLSPVQLSCGHGTASFAMNRREMTANGIRIGANPNGPTDHDVPVLKVATPDGRLRAVLFGYACHNTTLPAAFNEVDSDFAGHAQREVEKAHPGATAMFMILCAGDQNPIPRGDYAHVQQHGRELADAVDGVLTGKLRPVHPPIRTAYHAVQLDFAPHTRQTFEAEATDAGNAAKWKRRRAGLMLAAYDQGKPVRRLPYQVQAIRFNEELTLLALSGEVVVDYALRAKREFPGENLVVAGYSNDVSCYIPSLRVLRERGYEADDSMIYYGQPGPLAENVEEKIFSAIRRAMRKAGAVTKP